MSELSFLVPQRLAGTRGLRRGGHAWSESTVRAWSPDLACVFPPVSMPRCLCVQRPHFVLVSTRARLGPESKPGPVLEGPPPRVCEGSDTGSRVGLLRGRLARPAPLLPTVVPLEQECGPFPALPAWPPPRIPATQMQGDSGHLICPCGPTASAPGPGSGAGQARGCWGCPPAAMAPPHEGPAAGPARMLPCWSRRGTKKRLGRARPRGRGGPIKSLGSLPKSGQHVAWRSLPQTCG